MKLLLVIIASAAFAGALIAGAVWGVRKNDKSRRKATDVELALRARVLKEVKLEPNVTVGGDDEMPSVKIIFPVAPPGVDRKELEDKVRAMAREEFPLGVIDVGFADNLRKRLTLPPPPEQKFIIDQRQ